MAQKHEPVAEPAPQLWPSPRKLADEFLVHTQSAKNPETLAIQTKVLQRFCDRHKGLWAAELKGRTVRLARVGERPAGEAGAEALEHQHAGARHQDHKGRLQLGAQAGLEAFASS